MKPAAPSTQVDPNIPPIALLLREGRKVKIAKPPADMDFNDVLRLPENVAVFRPSEAAHG